MIMNDIFVDNWIALRRLKRNRCSDDDDDGNVGTLAGIYLVLRLPSFPT